MSELGIGIVGTGQRCMFYFGPYLKAHPEQGSLIALADQDSLRLNSAVKDLGGNVRSYNSLDAMLLDSDIEAVIITTPDFTHREMLRRALEAGKHVICEKPMATTIVDAIQMTKLALSSPQIVQIGFMLRHAPFFVKLKQVVESGVIGPLVHVVGSEVVDYYHGASFFRRWHRFRRNSGGLLVHKACHTLDVINWLVGAIPQWVSAIGGTDTFVPKGGEAQRCRDCSLASSCLAAYKAHAYNWIYQAHDEREDPWEYASDMCAYLSEKDSIDNALMNVGYSNGVRLAFGFSTTGTHHERALRFTGQGGTVHARQSEGIIVVEPVDGKQEVIILPEEARGEHGGGDDPLMDSFFQCVDTGRRPVADVMSGLYSVVLGVAATQSIDNGGQGIELEPYWP